MIRASIGEGGLYGLPIMKFTLTFDGKLKSNANTKEKWDIRNQISPQLQELWETHPVLIQTIKQKYVSAGREIITDVHHSVSDLYPKPFPHGIAGAFNLCETISKGGRDFMPLIRNSLALRCGLNITFLRKEEPGHIRNPQGDLDNRMKTLLDALSMPQHPEQILPSEKTGPLVYSLLEDDSLLSGLNIETGRLLTRPNSPKTEVRLIIEVDVRVAEARMYNHLFLGD